MKTNVLENDKVSCKESYLYNPSGLKNSEGSNEGRCGPKAIREFESLISCSEEVKGRKNVWNKNEVSVEKLSKNITKNEVGSIKKGKEDRKLKSKHGSNESSISKEVVTNESQKLTIPMAERILSNRSNKFLSRHSSNSTLVHLFEEVFRSGQPNFMNRRISLPFNKFNIPLWRDLLVDYSDNIICEFLEFGFPLDFNTAVALATNERRNHKGAKEHPEYVSNYLKNETGKSRIAGPFTSNPLSVPIMVSPLNTVPKAGSDERRVIVDLSWPLETGSVNSGISKEYYLEQKIELHYASIEDVCQMVLNLGSGALIFKRDLRQAYRQFPVDPSDYYLLGYYWDEQYFFDTVLAMGQRNAGVGCSRVTNAVMHIFSECGHQGVSYLDDLIGVSDSSRGWEAYELLGQLLIDLGLEENLPKACSPSTVQTVLGVVIDTVAMTVSVTEERMIEIHEILKKWEKKATCKKKDLQSLIGKLCFICKCVRQSRVFLNRLLATLRSVEWKTNTRINLSEDFHKELKWWSLFMDSFNGVAFIPSPTWSEPDVTMATDSCLDGCGGVCFNQYFHTKFPDFILVQQLPIHELEFLAVLAGARAWGHLFKGQKIRIYCDNQPVVDVINSSKTKDAFMATCLRELWLVVSLNEFELRAVHLPGEDNRVADWLSRWHLGTKYQDAFNAFAAGSVYEDILISEEFFKFSGVL